MLLVRGRCAHTCLRAVAQGAPSGYDWMGPAAVFQLSGGGSEGSATTPVADIPVVLVPLMSLRFTNATRVVGLDRNIADDGRTLSEQASGSGCSGTSQPTVGNADNKADNATTTTATTAAAATTSVEGTIDDAGGVSCNSSGHFAPTNTATLRALVQRYREWRSAAVLVRGVSLKRALTHVAVHLELI